MTELRALILALEEQIATLEAELIARVQDQSPPGAWAKSRP
jgi:hypothetical protein